MNIPKTPKEDAPTDRVWYLLDGHDVVPCTSDEWAKRFQDRQARRVALTLLEDDKVRVSTVFLGLDHGCDDGPPLIFETMIFGGEHEGYMDRCSTWDEAEAMHQRAVDMASGRKSWA